jgi:hypothetical protein
MTKARLIKRHEIKEREEQQEPETEEKKRYTKERVGVVDWPKRNKSQDPRKAFADLFIQPQTQTR